MGRWEGHELLYTKDLDLKGVEMRQVSFYMASRQGIHLGVCLLFGTALGIWQSGVAFPTDHGALFFVVFTESFIGIHYGATIPNGSSYQRFGKTLRLA